ncbi:MAG: hypothetical protein IIY39_00665 [Firmicutes bacterium]|nr:hypothetical protein [Bacillota bacterium]
MDASEKQRKISKLTVIAAAAVFFLIICLWAVSDSAKAEVTDEYMDYAENYAGIKWAVKLGTGWANNPTPPAIHDDYLYVETKSNVLKINRHTGKTVRKVSIPSGQIFNIIPVTYVEKSAWGSFSTDNGETDGILLVPLAENQVRGLDADTLDTLFTTRKDGSREMTEGYQITTNIVCDGEGYYYFGTWYGDVQKGYYYCYRIGERDPVWRVEHKGGFYLANAYVSDRYVYFASENGLRSQDGGTNTPLYTCMKGADYDAYDVPPETPVVDQDPVMAGNSRAAVVSDGEALYTVTQAGYAYKFRISTEEGTEGLPEPCATESGTVKVKLPAASTGEATIYKGVIYYCCADGTVNSYSTEDLSKISSVKGFGYTQNGIMLSTAKESGEGLYLYGSYNKEPGGIFAAKADAEGRLSGMIELFTPPKDLRQFNMTGILMEDGRIYYRNDSGYLMALEPGYTLWTQATAGGTVTAGLSAEAGSSHTFYIKAKSGYKCVDVTVDGTSKGVKTKYTFSNVSAPHELKAAFIKIPAKTTVKATALKGRKARITWKRAAAATGYQIYRSTKKNGTYKRIKTINKGTTLKWINKKLRKGQRYYYKVRTFRKVNGKTAYGAFSNKSYCRAKK